jgi:OCT family organic cation transporter-like MFS transporter 4/5
MPGEIQLDGTFKMDHCRRYKPNVESTRNTEYGEVCSPAIFLNETIKCDQWVFDQGGSHTIVEQFKVTCEENEWKLAFVGTAHFAGVILGSLWLMFGD